MIENQSKGGKQEKDSLTFVGQCSSAVSRKENNRLDGRMRQWEDFNTQMAQISPQIPKMSLETRLENELTASNKVI